MRRDDYVKQYSNVSNMRKIRGEGVGPTRALCCLLI